MANERQIHRKTGVVESTAPVSNPGSGARVHRIVLTEKGKRMVTVQRSASSGRFDQANSSSK